MKQKKSVSIYARVSTERQAVDMQLAELREYVQRAGWKVYREFVDEGYTGKNTARPAFKQVLDEARRRKFDVLLVWKLDRLSRSLKDLISTLDEAGPPRVLISSPMTIRSTPVAPRANWCIRLSALWLNLSGISFPSG